ncbi:MAG TPA: polyprenyl synthetase family protein [Bacteroidia bacterium]|nr:polyprenyl synthetase family protein [Bacteroidia bacterium]
MSKTIDEIKKPVALHMESFEMKFKDAMKSSVPLLDKITSYIVKRKGKRIRPMFVFLSAQAAGSINDSTHRAAALIELLHTATLVHDDVVDDSNERRGFFSVNALWKNKIAVLIGDFLLSKGLLLSLDNNDFHLLKIVSTAVREMSEGELLQIEKARRLDISEEIYFEIITKKTATLIAACCAAGVASVTDNEKTISLARDFGTLTGIAFQIKDDLFDFGTDENIGKPTGIDIKEKKMTLPLIYALNNCTWMEKRKIINIIKNHNEESEKVKTVIDFVIEKGGIVYANKVMREYKEKALAVLAQLPKNSSSESLERLLTYAIERKK